LPAALNQRVACLRNDPNKIARKYLFHLLNQGDFEQNCIDSSNGVAQKNLSTIWLSKYKIPLPPIEVQEEIVAELDNYQKIIEGARQVVESYNPHIDIDPEWSMVDFGDVCKALSNGVNFSKEQVGRGTKFINIKDLFSDGYIDISGLERVELSDKEIERNQVFEDDMLFVRSSVKYEGVGFPSLAPFVNEPLVFCGFIIKASLDKNVLNPKFLLFLLRTEIYRKKVIALSNKANITNISQDNLKALKIPLPSLDIQARIVEQIELEQELIRKSKQLSFMFMQKIKNSIKKAWNK
jgi:type I restriction enzyme M protein